MFYLTTRSCRQLSVMLTAIALSATSPALAQGLSPSATPALGLIADITGKTYRSKDDYMSVGMSSDGRHRVRLPGDWVMLINIDAAGKPQVKYSYAGSLKWDAEIVVGPGGVMFLLKKEVRAYIIPDEEGNLDVIITRERPQGPELWGYTKMVDPTRPDAARLIAASGTLSHNTDVALVERNVGVSFSQLRERIEHPLGSRWAAQTKRDDGIANRPISPQPPVISEMTSAGAGLRIASVRPAQHIGALTSPRIALVIGNARYAGTLGNLANPVSDAHAVAAALQVAGFQVVELDDADQRTMKRAIIAFGQRLNAAGRASTGLFYYAGHGVQSRGVNFLLPVGASIETEADIDVEAVAADTVLRQMEEAGVSTSIVILDACRNLPVQRVYRDGTRGLARMEAPNGSFVAYSTAPGSVAADGKGTNSPFATALVAEIAKPGQQIEITFKNVRRAVQIATGGKQTPWDSSSLVDSFVFQPDSR